ncbi:MAG: hypothetical protein LBP92_04255 [Deltaproteobacteria bacterium]|jgi:hypothetical protein|nr:hypothetical protein [Deltaproteobacteria bacterium]
MIEAYAFLGKPAGILPGVNEFGPLGRRYRQDKAEEAMISEKHIDDYIDQFAIII